MLYKFVGCLISNPQQKYQSAFMCNYVRRVCYSPVFIGYVAQSGQSKGWLNPRAQVQILAYPFLCN